MERPIPILLSTRNRDKAAELAHALHGLPLRVISVGDIGDWPDVEESGEALAENAWLKARDAFVRTGLPVLADDTGLEVDALAGAPGLHSSRFAGERATYAENVDKLLRELIEVPENARTARFRCVVALISPDGREEAVDGVVEGRILITRRGEGGFGYDPVFLVPELGRTFAEMTLTEKEGFSHRGRAMQEARRVLESWIPGLRAWQDSNLRPTD